MHFRRHSSGLHVHIPEEEHLVFVNTVEENKKAFTKREIKGAEIARSLYAKLVYPSIKDFEWAVVSNLIQDCPITKRDIEVAQAIWGKDVCALKGKTVRSNAPRVGGMALKVPREFLNLHREVYLTVDLFFVNKIIFFLTLSRKIDYTSVTHLSSRKIAKIFKAFKALYKFYLQRGFRITEVHADNEFAPLEALIADMPRGPRLNVTSADEHVPEIERRIRVVKERARAIRHSLPFDRIPRLMTTHMILTVVKILNYFPTKSGLSGTWSPRMLMSGRPLSYKKDLALEFGSYCQVHQHDLPRNSQKERTTGGICLGPSGNEQGGFKFMNLTTGAKFTGFKWDELPIPDAVIKRVNHLGKDQPKELTFFDRHGKPIEDDDVETTGVDGTNQAPTNDDIALDIQDELQEIAEIDETQQAIELNDPNNVQLQPVGEDADTPIVDTEAVVDEQPDPEMPLPEPELEPAPSGPTNPVPPAPTVQEPVESTGVRRSTRVRFAAKAPYVPSMTGKRYVTAVNHLENHGALHPDQHAAFFEHMQQEQPDVVAAVMTQLSLKAGLKA